MLSSVFTAYLQISNLEPLMTSINWELEQCTGSHSLLFASQRELGVSLMPTHGSQKCPPTNVQLQYFSIIYMCWAVWVFFLPLSQNGKTQSSFSWTRSESDLLATGDLTVTRNDDWDKTALLNKQMNNNTAHTWHNKRLKHRRDWFWLN